MKKLILLILSLFVFSCDSGGSGGDDGFSIGNDPPDASAMLTGGDNEVVLTIQVDSSLRVSFDEDEFIDVIASDLDCDIADIQIINTSIQEFLVHVAFIFVNNVEELLEDIQDAMVDGTIGGYEAIIIIANMDEDLCNMDIDCAGICNGETYVDACGECGGDSSDCDAGDLVGFYKVYNIRGYSNINGDGSCSGSIVDQLNGPTFVVDDSFDYSYGECNYYSVSQEALVQQFVELSDDGEYTRFQTQDDVETSYSDCYGGECSNGECYSCYFYSTDENFISLDMGTWSADDEYVEINPTINKQWLYGTLDYSFESCGEVDSGTYSSDGCMDENDYYYGYNDVTSYHQSGNKLYISVPNDYYYYYYYYYYYDDFAACLELELRKTSDRPTIGGCTDPFSDNYNPVATDNDGSCDEGYCDFYYRTHINNRYKNHPLNQE